MKDIERVGKFLSLILRHNPTVINIKLDSNGWADISELLAGMKRKGYNIDMAELEQIVETNNKKRYSFNHDKTKIRANQGHSLNIDLELKPVSPPDILYHGTAERFLEGIKRDGLKKISRNHVHLSADAETAVNVGKRHGRPLVLIVNAKAMNDDGHLFYISENGVWLTDYVPVEYLNFAAKK